MGCHIPTLPSHLSYRLACQDAMVLPIYGAFGVFAVRKPLIKVVKSDPQIIFFHSYFGINLQSTIFLISMNGENVIKLKNYSIMGVLK